MKKIYIFDILIIYFIVYFPNPSRLRVPVKPKSYVLADQPSVHNAGVSQGGSVINGATHASGVFQV